MSVFFVRNDTVQNGLGYAVPNVSVTYYIQPALTLATVYSDPSGTPANNPQLTDGLGQTAAYMAAGTYTVTYSGMQIQTETLPDQNVGNSGGGGGSTVTAFSGIPAGTVDGTNRVFTFAVVVNPSQVIVFLNVPLVLNVGYTLSWTLGILTIVYAVAPQPTVGSVPGDTLFVEGWYES